ncbi:response regulator [Thiomicrorhabdus xiamenensis]|uniref:Response regulator n=1 Tax=Thiomicrorhabdus xiamenensis TaxID=2739063 RepID=A0A7D4NJW8_9GAMM|nr:response regulator [Thiomicrorhabdus xiamenensis]QKI88689.1 response regulator [Thiomicrorhabdus xiamenensis]
MYRILVVDDSDVICSLLKLTLQSDGHQVQVTKNLHDAQEIVDKEVFDLIIADYMLSREENGLQLVSHLQETVNASTPVIMLSAEAMPEHKAEAKQLGVNAWMKKPFSPHGILKIIHKVIEEQEA